MSITERSRRRVREALDRLESEYGDLDVVEKTWYHPPETYEAVRERFEAGTLGGAGCWTTDDEGRVLLVRHGDEQEGEGEKEGEDEERREGEKEGEDEEGGEGEAAWSDPGGKHEPDETLEEAARRETCEEAGVEVEIRGVRQAHRIEVQDETGENPPIHRLIVVFDAEYVSGDPRPREGEIADVRWWREHPDDLLYPELAEFPIPAAE